METFRKLEVLGEDWERMLSTERCLCASVSLIQVELGGILRYPTSFSCGLQTGLHFYHQVCCKKNLGTARFLFRGRLNIIKIQHYSGTLRMENANPNRRKGNGQIPMKSHHPRCIITCVHRSFHLPSCSSNAAQLQTSFSEVAATPCVLST